MAWMPHGTHAELCSQLRGEQMTNETSNTAIAPPCAGTNSGVVFGSRWAGPSHGAATKHAACAPSREGGAAHAAMMRSLAPAPAGSCVGCCAGGAHATRQAFGAVFGAAPPQLPIPIPNLFGMLGAGGAGGIHGRATWQAQLPPVGCLQPANAHAAPSHGRGMFPLLFVLLLVQDHRAFAVWQGARERALPPVRPPGVCW